MHPKEKNISYTTTNSYSTLNRLTESTKNVWIVLHGIGYLSRYFLKYFDMLPPDENYIIAPQAPSKYYLHGQFKHVGASWLTKENTETDIENVVAYLDAVYAKENIPNSCRLIVFGFSQGVSIATRWVAKRKLTCDGLILYAGGIPNDLSPDGFDFLKDQTKITVVVGNKDEYLTERRMQSEKVKIENLFRGRAELLIFEGRHEVKKEIIKNLV